MKWLVCALAIALAGCSVFQKDEELAAVEQLQNEYCTDKEITAKMLFVIMLDDYGTVTPETDLCEIDVHEWMGR